jgi:hypothetical protein
MRAEEGQRRKQERYGVVAVNGDDAKELHVTDGARIVADDNLTKRTKRQSGKKGERRGRKKTRRKRPKVCEGVRDTAFWRRYPTKRRRSHR